MPPAVFQTANRRHGIRSAPASQAAAMRPTATQRPRNTAAAVRRPRRLDVVDVRRRARQPPQAAAVATDDVQLGLANGAGRGERDPAPVGRPRR
jgi:hypothetical protein